MIGFNILPYSVVVSFRPLNKVPRAVIDSLGGNVLYS